MSSETPNSGHAKPPIPTPAKKVPAWNIEKRNDRLYEVTTLHKWFAISSLLLFVFTVVMIMADYSREWKRYQREYSRLSIQRAQQDFGKVLGSVDKKKYNQLVDEYEAAKKSQAQNSAEISKANKKLSDLQAIFVRIDTNYKNSKAKYGTEKYDLDEAVAAAKKDPKKQPEADHAATVLTERDKEMADLFKQREELSTNIIAAKAEVEKFVGKGEQARKGLEDLFANYTRAKTQLNALDPGFVVTTIRNAPVMDMLNASEKVQQILLSNLYNDQPFKQIPRVDRCITCHQGIDNKNNANNPLPYKTHSNMNLYIASGSKHPMETFGCTSCHGGLDRATDFQSAGHTPRNEKQKEEWVKKYGWHTDEFQIAAAIQMAALDKVESGCYKCHNSSPEVSQAAALDNGRDLIRMYGCFGCHKIPGYDGVRKVGPDLSTVSGKLTKDWVEKWLADPKAFKSEARMPRFWNNTNNSGNIGGTDWNKRSAAEIHAITEFIWSKSKPKALPAANPSGNAAHGKELVESVGCYGCHSVGPIEQAGNQSQTRRRHGFNLTAQGSKVSASWIYNWVKDPKLVWAETKMPSLRLSDSEAADITAYLSSLKNDAFTAKPLPTVDTAALDTIVLEFLRNNSTDLEARTKLKTMSLEEKNLMAGERLVRRYGCFGCHNIPGMEKEQPIGTELTEAGSKLVSQLDFGFLPIEHDRADWYAAKLTDPRIFDKDRVKTPEELLKMPNFTFSPQDVQSITMVLTSMVKDKVPQEMREKLSREVIAGRQLIAEKNCKGCHIIEQLGGDIRGFLKDNQLQYPPNLNTQGLKTQPMWLAKFINDPGAMKLRVFLNTRMPTFHFTQNEISTLTAYFSAVDKAPFPFISTAIETTPEKLRVGAQLFESLKCMQCHPTNSIIPPGKDPADLAPNLQLAAGRLRPEWIPEWLKDPQKIAPGTRMPGFFPDYPKSPDTKTFGGDAKAQIEAIRDHLFVTVGGGARTTAAGN